MKRTLLILLLAASISGVAPLTLGADSLHWEAAWIRSVPPGAAVAAAYGKLVNHSAASVTVTGITSPLGAEAQMHDVVAEGDQRRMVQIDSVTLSSGEALIFTPGGRHIMLLDIQDPPAEGSMVPLCAIAAPHPDTCTVAQVQRQGPSISSDTSFDMSSDMPSDHAGHHH